MNRLLIGLIRAYRYLLSPWMGTQCRFYPSCSHYGEEAIQHYGAIKGMGLIIWRLLRCNPWHPGGFDYVPGTEPVQDTQPEENKTSQHKNITGVISNEF